ncbi:MAG: hypothetical protein RLZ86_79 [Actinomycetota bacterium]
MNTREIGRFEGVHLEEVYRTSREAITRLIADTDAERRRRIVPACPDWTVHDLVSHVTGIAVDLGAGRPPSGNPQSWVDRQVDERRDRTTADVIAEWEAACVDFEPMISATPNAFWGLVYDLVVHEFDLRNALGDRSGRNLERVAVAAELGLRLVKGDLRKAGLGAVVVDMAGDRIRVGDGDVGLTLRVDSFECLRMLGSRRTRDELSAADVDGDLSHYVDALVHMDLPVQSLGE